MSKVEAMRALREQRAQHTSTRVENVLPTVDPRPQVESLPTETLSIEGESAPVAAQVAAQIEQIRTIQEAERSDMLAPATDTAAAGTVYRGMHQVSDDQIAAAVQRAVDEGLSDPDDVLAAVMREFGFVRRGKVIKRRVFAALAMVPAA